MSATDNASDARIVLACLDLTSLNDDDDTAAIDMLCAQAIGPAGRGWPAAVCVWPRFVAHARVMLPAAIRVAAVANFPAGNLDLGFALYDTHAILDAGGDEVDLVLPWRAMQAGDMRGAAALVAAVRAACIGKTLKLIIESGCLTPEQIDKACVIGLDAGADFLKTSTGKTAYGASTGAAQRMLARIAGHRRRHEVGFKASGGVRTVTDAVNYIALSRQVLGDTAVGPARLRFGASGLLADLETVLGFGAGTSDLHQRH